jgi:hypothetical protein
MIDFGDIERASAALGYVHFVMALRKSLETEEFHSHPASGLRVRENSNDGEMLLASDFAEFRVVHSASILKTMLILHCFVRLRAKSCSLPSSLSC